MIGIWNTVSDVTRCSSTFIRQNKNGNSVSLDCLHGVSPIISNEKRETPSHRECFPLGCGLALHSSYYSSKKRGMLSGRTWGSAVAGVWRHPENVIPRQKRFASVLTERRLLNQ